jgi:hypothetical protein
VSKEETSLRYMFVGFRLTDCIVRPHRFHEKALNSVGLSFDEHLNATQGPDCSPLAGDRWIRRPHTPYWGELPAANEVVAAHKQFGSAHLSAVPESFWKQRQYLCVDFKRKMNSNKHGWEKPVGGRGGDTAGIDYQETIECVPRSDSRPRAPNLLPLFHLRLRNI